MQQHFRTWQAVDIFRAVGSDKDAVYPAMPQLWLLHELPLCIFTTIKQNHGFLCSHCNAIGTPADRFPMSKLLEGSASLNWADSLSCFECTDSESTTGLLCMLALQCRLERLQTESPLNTRTVIASMTW